MLLNGRLEIHGIDAEKLAGRALDDTLRSRGASLRPHEHEDALAYVIAELWRFSVVYDPSRASSFHTVAHRRGRLLALEWFRHRFGRTKWQFANRTHVRERPAVLSLDADEPGRRRLDEAVGTRASDPQNDRDPDLSRLLTGGDRQVARDLDALGLEPHGRAAA